MARLDTDDSDDTFVKIGQPLQPYDEDEAIKKPFRLQEQQVTDSRGRPRFHGAFTGGFSAGYFNTVGSKEGWTPSTFVSSQGKKSDSSKRRPEDFMDDEDLGEFGIAPQVVRATHDFSSTLDTSRKRPLVSDGVVPGEALLADIIKPASSTMGVRLLRKMGWRDGQGIGPRARRKKHRRTKSTSTEQKVYGCSMPTQTSDPSCSDEDALTVTQHVKFAPKDVTPLSFEPKDNLHGLGYSGITERMSSDRAMLYDKRGRGTDRQGRPTGRHKGMAGQAFGVGALEEEDDDIYGVSSMSNYDRSLGGADHSGTHGWTAPTQKKGGAKDEVDAILEGFMRLSTQLQGRKLYPPPQLPRDFKPRHIFTDTEKAAFYSAQAIPKKFSCGWKNIDASERREALGETPQIKSVFDLVSSYTRAHMKSCQLPPPSTGHVAMVTSDSGTTTTKTSTTSTAAVTSQAISGEREPYDPKAAFLAGLKGRFQSGGLENVTPGEETKTSNDDKPPNKGIAGGFTPFQKDPQKQGRYELYITGSKSGENEAYAASVSHMTEWERNKERDEFSRSATLYRPMSSCMATRFTHAQFTEDKTSGDTDKGGDANDQATAAEMKMYGQLTRNVMEWHPNNLLCKRFNVPNPYPESSFVGLPKAKREKFSVYNFLSFPGQVHEEPAKESAKEEPQSVAAPRRKILGQQSKPLAILASVDLRRPSQRSEVKVSESSEVKTLVDDTSKSTATDGDNVQKDNPSEGSTSDRPSMDVFRAVFGDSNDETESSSSSEDDDNEQKVSAPPEDIILPDVPHTVKEKLEVFESEQSVIGGHLNREKVTHLAGVSSENSQPTPAIHMVDMSQIQERLGLNPPEADPVAKEADSYGPALPPRLGHNISTICSVDNTDEFSIRSNKYHKKKKKHKETDKYIEKEKSREKPKHKKRSKHKKEKDKKKKKKKKKSRDKIITISSSSGSDADTEDNSSDTDTRPDIMNQLKNLGRRAVASDFM